MQDLKLDGLQESVANSISQARFGDALLSIKSFAEEVINDPESIAVVFASREIDNLCTAVADAYYADIHPEKGGCQGTVVLATELVRAGGHVELIKDYLASGQFPGPVRVVQTDLFNRVDLALIADWQSLLGCEVYVTSQPELDGKLSALTEKLREWNPSTILTLGHNQDVVCVVGAHFPGVTNRYYIHHGDHHLSLGVTCDAFQHVDLHNMSYELCKNEIGVRHQLYWPLGSRNPERTKNRFLERGALTTCSCGRTSKFESGTYDLHYERAVARILAASGGYHIHIGELPETFLQRIYAELDAADVSRDRFIHIEWVASLSRALIEHSVDVYISSFPLGGGKALIEAMSVGLPVVTHDSYRSRYHGGGDLTYPGSFSWVEYEDLKNIFERWDEPLLKQHSEAALQHFRRYYSEEAFLSAVASGADCAQHVPPLRRYRQNHLKNYLDFRRRRTERMGHLETENARILAEWQKVFTAYDRCVKTIDEVVAEKDRVFAEWQKVHLAYEECKGVIARQQIAIEQLTQDRDALNASYAAMNASHAAIVQDIMDRQLRDKERSSTLGSKFRRLLAVVLGK